MPQTSWKLTEEDLHCLRLLSVRYGTIESACTEIINLEAILKLPKGTEHFVSDIHGEYAAFSHVLRNASGVIRDMIDRVFGDTMDPAQKKTFATLIYYPEKKLALIEETEEPDEEWYRQTLHRLVRMCRAASSKYTRSKVRKALPASYAYIIEELLHEDEHSRDKVNYYDGIIETILRLDRAGDFICELAHLIQRFAIDRLHVLGDIFDRGKDSVKIMECLCDYHSVDIQWGNHDISWMGAAAGCQALVCNVIRIQARYANLGTLEDGYGINLVPLAAFAMEQYGDDPCDRFRPEPADTVGMSENEISLIAKMHKAIAIMQFKCEGQIIRRNPEFRMEDRMLLHRMDPEKQRVEIDGKTVPLCDYRFPTVAREDPYALTEKEADVLGKLTRSFEKNEKLQRHVRFLFSRGSLYRVYNGNLLFHGGVPLCEDGSFRRVMFRGELLCGKAYFDAIDSAVREGYFEKKNKEEKRRCQDLTWYLWCGADSPLYLKEKMTTFERYFTDDEALYEEKRNPYYQYRSSEKVCDDILRDFGLAPQHSHIINGHVPVQMKKGEKPVKAGGKLFVIDGGFAKGYQKVTGIAGYTLIYNSHGLILVSHEPFESQEVAVREEKDILSSTVEHQHLADRTTVAITDTGAALRASITDLEKLLYAYRKGILKEVGK